MSGFDERQTLDLNVKGEDKLRDLTKALKEEKAALEASNDAAKSGAQSLTSLEGVFASLRENGIKGTAQSLAGLASAIGPGGWLVIGANAAVAAFEFLGPAIRDAFDEWTKGSEKIPESADALERAAKALKEGKDELAELTKNWRGSAEELAKYNEALERTARLEREVTEERKRRAELDKARQEEAQAALSPEGAAAVKEAIGRSGGTDAVVGQVRNTLNDSPEARAAREKVNAALANAARPEVANSLNPEVTRKAREAVAEAERARDALTRRNETTAQDIVTKARQGDEAAIEQLAGLMPIGGFGMATREGRARTAERQAAQKRGEADAKRQEELAAARQDRKDMREAEDFIDNTLPKRGWRQREADRRKAAKHAAENRSVLDEDREREEMERAALGGFNLEESRAMALGGQALAGARAGNIDPKRIEEAAAMVGTAMRGIEEMGAPGLEGVYDRLMDMAGRLNQLQMQMARQAQMNQQFNQMGRMQMGGPIMGNFSAAPIYGGGFLGNQ